MYDMRKERDLLRQIESDVMMTAQEQEQFFLQQSKDAYLVVSEDREFPIHSRNKMPRQWLDRQQPHRFFGKACQGEYYTFQAGIYPAFDSPEVTVQAQGFPFPVTCFQTEGVDSFGKAFTQKLELAKEKVQPLWFGIEIPYDCPISKVEGTILLTPVGRQSTALSVCLEILEEKMEDYGDEEPWRHSRLRWLNSDIAVDDKITHPFTPLRVRRNTVRGLGHQLVLGQDGLPKQVQSFFENTNETLSLTPKEILQSAFTFTVDGAALAPTAHTPFVFTKTEDGIVCWEAERNLENGISVQYQAAMEFDGYISYDISVTAKEDVSVNDIALRIPYEKEAAQYLMGLDEMGGLRKKDLDWKWDQTRNQDTLWMGAVNAGMMVRLKDEQYKKPMMLIYYHYYPLQMPKSWYNEGKGGCRVREQAEAVLFEAYSGARTLSAGETLHFMFDLAITPVKPIDKVEHWQDHYYHEVADDLKKVSRSGANIVNIHHANAVNPYINYPFYETEDLTALVKDYHVNSIRAKLYYTVKEITVRQTELWAMKSLGNEIIPKTYEIGESFQGSVPYADDWMAKYLEEDYMTAWRQKIDNAKYTDEMEASVVAAPTSRFNNYFLEGVRWTLENTGMDGLYFDDVAFDRNIMKRVRKVLDRDHPRCTIDLHSWNYFKNNTVDNSELAGWGNSMNLYIDNFAFIDRIWFGEGFDYDVAPDHWLVEISGIPFGMMGEMLQFGGNVWRGMVFGMTNRLPNEKDPTGIWNMWNDFRIGNATMLGFWNPDCPVQTNHPELRATVYRQAHQAMIVVGSWAKEDTQVLLQIDYDALGMNPADMELSIPAIDHFQESYPIVQGQPLHIPAGEGRLILLTEKNV